MSYRFWRFDSADITAEPLQVFTYPMGDVTVKGRPTTGGAHVLHVATSRPDFSLIRQWLQLVTTHGDDGRPPATVLFMPYLPGARGDKDVPNTASVNAELTAACGPDLLVTLDPHSDRWLDAYRGFCDRRGSANAVGRNMEYLRLDLPTVVANAVAGRTYDAVIAPDAGAFDRASAVSAQLDLPVIVCSKHRDPETGRLSGYRTPDLGSKPRTFLVVDDICDGGGTFALLADTVPEQHVLDLWVTHGGFTKGPGPLKRYRNIFTTNSFVRGRPGPIGLRLTAVDLLPYLAAALARRVGNTTGGTR
ncbi:MAG: phosphoribosyltransferase family protein [Gordonia amarae]